jgi:hypothetical protein
VARTCKCCTHPRRAELDRELIANQRPYRSIAQDFAVSADSVFRHQRDHLPKLLVQAEGAKAIAQADDLLAQLKALNEKARELAAKAESAGDYRTALMAIRELTRLLELTAKLTGELDERASLTVNVNLSPAEGIAEATELLLLLLDRTGMQRVIGRFQERLAELEPIPPLTLEAGTGGQQMANDASDGGINA